MVIKCIGYVFFSKSWFNFFRFIIKWFLYYVWCDELEIEFEGFCVYMENLEIFFLNIILCRFVIFIIYKEWVFEIIYVKRMEF